MAGTGLLMLLDDIATVLDDIALMTKVAAKKTAGVLGDDLALNAQQVSGVASERELPVVWSVAKGSLLNKALLIPAALLISAFAPRLITPLLMLGGAYLCYEGAEKLLHHIEKRKKASSGGKQASAEKKAPELPAGQDLADYEKARIKGAVRTDFVLSAEIIVIALGTVPTESPFWIRAAVICLIGLLMTVGVYGLVAAIVKLDDAGYFMLRGNSEGSLRHRIGRILVGASPVLMRILSVVGTIAMFTVGGGILAHGLPFMHGIAGWIAALPAAVLLNALNNAVFGVITGAVIVGVVSGLRRVWFFVR